MPKISALPGAPITPLQPADLIVCVQGGVTSQATVADLPGSGGGGPTWTTPVAGILLWNNVSTSAQMSLNDNGSYNLQMDNDSQLIQDIAAAPQVRIGFEAVAFQRLILTVQNPNSLRMEINGFGFIEMGVGATNLLTINGYNNCFIQYNPAAPANWAVAMTDIWQALDRIAAALVILIPGPV